MSSKKSKSAIILKIFSALERNKKARKRERKPEVSKIFAAYRFKSLLLSPTARMLSLGAIRRIHQGMEEDDLILQVLGQKEMPGSNPQYRLLLSDGRFTTTSTILHPDMNYLIQENLMEKYSVIRVKMVCHKVDTKLVIILLDVKVLIPGTRVNGKFGNPRKIDCNDEFPETGNACQNCTKHNHSD